METVEVRNMQNEDSESLEVVVAEHLKQLQKKQKFEFAAQALTSIVQERYADATPAEQNAVIEGIFLRASFLLEVEWKHRLCSGCSRRISSILFYENAFNRWQHGRKLFLVRIAMRCNN
ncbi:uncharacterized protein [Physcomitrium patens]|uniref:uncharacterized protein isoform X1 n=1 Tax=Physcomitrium patens TaxID=3218 RepID=UPI003CCCEEBF